VGGGGKDGTREFLASKGSQHKLNAETVWLKSRPEEAVSKCFGVVKEEIRLERYCNGGGL